ncbi:MAG: hypothetical protein H6Q31_2979 [Bacteroidetes bacterium]|jgi:hypothetical protein|nr:hypothetical protein [Bacteroidota bacterium]
MKKSYTIAALLIALAAGPMHSLADDPYTLRMGLEQGKSYLYTDHVTASIVQEMGGQEMKSLSTSSIVSRISVDAVLPDGSFSLITQLDSMTASTKSPRMDTTRVMTDIMGKRSRVVLSPLGKVLQRAIIDSIKAAGPMMRGAAAREVIRFQTLPEQAVVVGAQWTVTSVDTNEMMGGKMVTGSTITYTLNGKEEKGGRTCVKIGYTGTMTIEGKGSMMGMEVFSEGKGTLSGTWHFDPAAGITVADESQMDTDVTMAMTGQQNMTMPITTSSKTSRILRAIEEMKK